jgi:nitronate monooxygenase
MEHFRPFEKDVPPYPIQNALTAEIRKKAASQNRLEMMSLWAGQGSPMARALPAAQLVETLVDELDAVLHGVARRYTSG